MTKIITVNSIFLINLMDFKRFTGCLQMTRILTTNHNKFLFTIDNENNISMFRITNILQTAIN